MPRPGRWPGTRRSSGRGQSADASGRLVATWQQGPGCGDRRPKSLSDKGPCPPEEADDNVGESLNRARLEDETRGAGHADVVRSRASVLRRRLATVVPQGR